MEELLLNDSGLNVALDEARISVQGSVCPCEGLLSQ